MQKIVKGKLFFILFIAILTFSEWAIACLICPPPYNVSSKGCLGGFAKPSDWEIIYAGACAEKPPEGISTYWSPKIRVRFQGCIIGCWQEEADLNWDGECVLWFSPNALENANIRVCARLAVPKDPLDDTNNIPDHGWKNRSIDETGHATGTIDPADYEKPRICAYKDNWILNTSITTLASGDYDILDIFPNSQPSHKSDARPAIYKILMFILDATDPQNVIDLVFSLMGSSDTVKYLKYTVSVIYIIFNIKQVIGRALIKEVLDAIGYVNKSAEALNGAGGACVEIPLGPFPPAYCPFMKERPSYPKVSRICQVKLSEEGSLVLNSDNNLLMERSTFNDECDNSIYINNFIRNSVRVGYDNLIPLCKSTDPADTECVKFSNFDSSNLALASNILASNMIANCAVNSNVPCATVPNCGSKCQDYFRLVFTDPNNQSYVYPNLTYINKENINPAIPETPRGIIWGINRGQFADLKCTYKENGNPICDNDTKLLDFSTGKIKSFKISIEDATEKNKLCVYEKVGSSDTLMECVKRASAPKIEVENCADNLSLTGCSNNTHIDPKIVLKLKVGNSSCTSTNNDPNGNCFILKSATSILNANNYKIDASNPANISNSNEYNFIGAKIKIYPTNSDGISNPYSSGNINSFKNATYGTYLGDPNVDNTNLTMNNIDRFRVHMSDLFVMGSYYFAGGTKLCASDARRISCDKYPELCVITKLIDGSNCIVMSSNNLRNPSNMLQCMPSALMSDRVFPLYNASSAEQIIPEYFLTKKTISTNFIHEYVYANQDINYPGRVVPNINWENPARILNPDYEGMRLKNEIEMGKCVNIPAPSSSCAPITIAGSSSGNATWLQTQASQVATGSCQDGFTAPKNNKIFRSCLLNVYNGSASWQNLSFDAECSTSATSKFKCNKHMEITSNNNIINANINNASLINSKSKLYYSTIPKNFPDCNIHSQEFTFSSALNEDKRIKIVGAIPKGKMLIRIDNQEVYNTEYLEDTIKAKYTCESAQNSDLIPINLNFNLKKNTIPVITVATYGKNGPSTLLFEVNDSSLIVTDSSCNSGYWGPSPDEIQVNNLMSLYRFSLEFIQVSGLANHFGTPTGDSNVIATNARRDLLILFASGDMNAFNSSLQNYQAIVNNLENKVKDVIASNNNNFSTANFQPPEDAWANVFMQIRYFSIKNNISSIINKNFGTQTNGVLSSQLNYVNNMLDNGCQATPQGPVCKANFADELPKWESLHNNYYNWLVNEKLMP